MAGQEHGKADSGAGNPGHQPARPPEQRQAQGESDSGADNTPQLTKWSILRFVAKCLLFFAAGVGIGAAVFLPLAFVVAPMLAPFVADVPSGVLMFFPIYIILVILVLSRR